jgi:hypothetical protein
MALKNERMNENCSCFEVLDVLSEGLGDCYGASKSFIMV